MPEGGSARSGKVEKLVTVGTFGLAAPLFDLAAHVLGQRKSGLIVLKIQLDGGIHADVLFEAPKREKSYNKFMKLLR